MHVCICVCVCACETCTVKTCIHHHFPVAMSPIWIFIKSSPSREIMGCLGVGNARARTHTHTHTHNGEVVVVVVVMQTAAGHIMRNMSGFLLQ